MGGGTQLLRVPAGCAPGSLRSLPAPSALQTCGSAGQAPCRPWTCINLELPAPLPALPLVYSPASRNTWEFPDLPLVSPPYSSLLVDFFL